MRAFSLSPARLLPSLIAAIGLSVACAAPAFADVTFNALTPTTYPSGVSFNSELFKFTLNEGPVAAMFGLVGSTAVIANANDPTACDIAPCPVGGDGRYLGILNDGSVTIGLDGTIGTAFVFSGLDFAFIAPVQGLLNGSYGQLVINAVAESGATLSRSFALPGQDAAGNFRFDGATFDSAFANTRLTSLTLSACVNTDAGCVNSFDAPAMNQAQFAVDNLRVNVVPEPGSAAILGAGLMGLIAARRRRSAAAPR